GRTNYGGSMPTIDILGGRVAYEILGEGDPIVLTPGGRFSMGVAGLRPFAEALAPHMKVLLWDRPNAGASDLTFTVETESDMHADTLAELLRQLEMTPAVVAGGSAGAAGAADCRVLQGGMIRARCGSGVDVPLRLGLHKRRRALQSTGPDPLVGHHVVGCRWTARADT